MRQRVQRRVLEVPESDDVPLVGSVWIVWVDVVLDVIQHFAVNRSLKLHSFPNEVDDYPKEIADAFHRCAGLRAIEIPLSNRKTVGNAYLIPARTAARDFHTVGNLDWATSARQRGLATPANVNRGVHDGRIPIDRSMIKSTIECVSQRK